MPFFNNRKVEKNYDLLSACAWYTPGVSGLFAVLGWFLVGMVLAALVTMPMMFGGMTDLSYVMLIMYPIHAPIWNISISRDMTLLCTGI